MRASGILLPISSIPSNYGIGSFSKEAYEFVDILKKAGQSYWQILPLGPTGYGDSPYQSFSTYAGNPYFIDLEYFIECGWLTEEECEGLDYGDNSSYVDYAKIYDSRWELLRTAYKRSDITSSDGFKDFCKENKEWLDEYALYTVIKKISGGKGWNEWDDKYRLRNKGALKKVEKEYEEELMFHKFLQYEFAMQWSALKQYANDNGIKIIGDIPIYVAFDSADSWASPELFQFDKEGNPIAVAGCPPDGFSATGQLWGNPLYNWPYHKKTGYEWWLNRIAHCNQWYDVIRIDHFRGFDEYYAIPYGDETAENGEWEAGPGIELFEKVSKELPEVEIIAEDLGVMTPTVELLLKESGYPGMKVIQFAFDGDYNNFYLPYNHVKNSVVYTGTHDNETLTGWIRGLEGNQLLQVQEFVSRGNNYEGEITWELIRLAQGSVSDLCMIPIQDYLCLGNEARINHPSTLGDNWKWRLEKEQISEELIQAIYRITRIHGRAPIVEEVEEIEEIEELEEE